MNLPHPHRFLEEVQASRKSGPVFGHRSGIVPYSQGEVEAVERGSTFPAAARRATRSDLRRRRPLRREDLEGVGVRVRVGLHCSACVLGWRPGEGDESGAKRDGQRRCAVAEPQSGGHATGLFESVQQRAEVLGQRGSPLAPGAVQGVGEGEAAGVQGLSLEALQSLLHRNGHGMRRAAAGSVDRIARDGVSDVMHVDPDLMRAAGLEPTRSRVKWG